MNTLKNAYLTKLSSSTIATLLIFSSLVVMVPLALPILPANAANTQFSSKIYYPYVIVGTTGAVRTLKITNPLGNLGITEVDVNFPAASAQAVSSGAFPSSSGFINTGSPVVSGTGPWTIVYPGTSSTATILPAGSAGKITFTFTSEASESTPGVADVYSLTVTVHYTDGSTQANTVSLYEGSATAVTTTAVSGTTFTVGQSVTYTMTVSGGAGLGGADSGIPLTFVSLPSTTDIANDGFSASFTPATATTGAATTLTTSFTTTEASTQVATDGLANCGSGYYCAKADAGTAASTDSGGTLTSSNGALAVNFLASGPTQVKVKTSFDVAGKSVSYVNSGTASAVTLSLADKYGNTVTGETGTGKLTALAGSLSHYGEFAISGSTMNMTINYTPYAPGATTPLNFGTFDLISASLSVTAPSTIAGTYSGTSKQLSIGYLAGTNVATATLTVTYYAASGTPQAGSTIGLSFTVSGPIQVGVPVNFTLTSTSTTTPYTGTFANGLSWIVVTTNKLGVAAANFTADTTAGHAATANAIVSEPSTAFPTNTATSPSTAPIQSVAAKASALKVVSCSASPCTPTSTTRTSYTTSGGKLYVDVVLQDKYGNTVASTFSYALQITLSASVSGAGFSSTTVYITTGNSDTQTSGYTVQFTAPSSLGPVTITAATSQPGIGAGTKTITVVSPNPRVFITSPTNSTTSYSTMKFSGYAMPSLAAPSGTVVTTFKYNLNGAGNVTTPITSTNSSAASFFSFTVSLVNGTNTLKVYAIDSNGNSAVVSYTISRTPPPPPVVFGNSVQVQGTPSVTTLAGFKGVSATYKNLWNTTLNVVVFAVWKNSAGQTVAVTTAGLTIASGATGTTFAPLVNPLPSGTYTVNIFVVTTSNNPVSSSTTITVSV